MISEYLVILPSAAAAVFLVAIALSTMLAVVLGGEKLATKVAKTYGGKYHLAVWIGSTAIATSALAPFFVMGARILKGYIA